MISFLSGKYDKDTLFELKVVIGRTSLPCEISVASRNWMEKSCGTCKNKIICNDLERFFNHIEKLQSK